MPTPVAHGTDPSAITDAQQAALRIQLVQQRRFRLEQLATLDRLAFRVCARGTAADLEVHDQLVSGARAALTDVDAAIDRMNAGSYGRCAFCGETLPIERLEVLPHVALCMSCQRVQDALR
ncbi:MAG: TraR/DksA C4-type zinc finger protein [Actinobacteria bacterium]|nr:TraR/DksA C4-type zinc finger protein [Actinomycetota bacterium]